MANIHGEIASSTLMDTTISLPTLPKVDQIAAIVVMAIILLAVKPLQVKYPIKLTMGLSETTRDHRVVVVIIIVPHIKNISEVLVNRNWIPLTVHKQILKYPSEMLEGCILVVEHTVGNRGIREVHHSWVMVLNHRP